MTPIEIYQGIEEILEAHSTRTLEQMFGSKDLSNEELRDLRGQMKAVKVLTRMFRNNLGYNPEDL